MSPLRKQWEMDDWKRDIARYEECRAKIASHPAPHFEKLREHLRNSCQEIANRYPHIKFEPIAQEAHP